MASAAWQALTDQNTLSDVTAVLLSAPPASPATRAAVMDVMAVGPRARKGAPWLEHYADGIPLRRVTFDVIGSLPDGVDGPVSVSGVALLYLNSLVALRSFAAVQMTRENPELVVPIDWSVSAYGEGDQ